MVGARSCKYCGSPKHWDKDCKHSSQGLRRKVNFAEVGIDELRAEADYLEAYTASLEVESEDKSLEESEEDGNTDPGNWEECEGTEFEEDESESEQGF